MLQSRLYMEEGKGQIVLMYVIKLELVILKTLAIALNRSNTPGVNSKPILSYGFLTCKTVPILWSRPCPQGKVILLNLTKSSVYKGVGRCKGKNMAQLCTRALRCTPEGE